MAIRLLDDVVNDIYITCFRGDRNRVRAILEQTVRERAGLMHERAQRAESRAHQAEAALERLTKRAGFCE